MGKPEKTEAKTSAEIAAASRAFRAKIRWATRADAVALRSIYSYYVEKTTVSFELETPSVAEMERRVAEVEGVYPFLVCVVEEENGEDAEDFSVDACDAAAKIDKNGESVEFGEINKVDKVGGERIVGYASAHRAFERAAYSWTAETSVYVDRAWRRRGIGEALYSALIEILEAQGVRTLYAVVVAENEASVEFHRRVGYREFATFKSAGWKFERWLDVVWLERTLGAWRDAKSETPRNTASESEAATKANKLEPVPTPVRPLADLPKARLTEICDLAARRFAKKIDE